jgi:hypothetical protein
MIVKDLEIEIYNKLSEFNKEIEEANNIIADLSQKRLEWCYNNKKIIKNLYPRKNKIYRVLDPVNGFEDNEWCEYRKHWYFRTIRESVKINSDDIYYFKVENNRMEINRDFGGYNSRKSSATFKVKGEILDSNFEHFASYIDISIKYLDVENPVSSYSDKFTKVYVMIDKNTGYYKIGRSSNPLKREKTLQSEKPTIELLFHHDARISNEKELHDMFSDKRVRGEWFDLNGSDLSIIRNYFEDKTQAVRV